MCWPSLNKLMVHFLLFIILLIPLEISRACGPYFDAGFHGYTFVNENIIDQSNRLALAPLLHGFDNIYRNYFAQKDSLNRNENIAEWQDRYCGLVTKKDLEYIVYKASINDLNLLKSNTKSNSLPVPNRLLGNSFAHYVHENKCTENIDYLIFAKKCEPHVVSIDGWQKPKKNKEAMQDLIAEGVRLSKPKNTKSHYMRLRYAYQVIRLAHYAGLYEKALELYEELMPKIDRQESGFEESIIPWWIEGHRAGALMRLGRRVEASYLYAQIFRHSPSRRMSAYQSFSLRSNEEWEECLRMCHSDAERAMLYVIRASNPKSRAVEEMEAVYRLDPINPHLEVLLVQEVKKLERNLLGLEFNSKRKQNKRYHGLPQSDAGDYVISLQSFVRKCREEEKVERPGLWKIAEGYLEFLAGDFYAAEKTFGEAAHAVDDEALKEQLDAFRLAMFIARFNKPSAAIEQTAYDIIRDNELYASYTSFPEFLRDKMRWLYEQNGQEAKAFLCYKTLDDLKPNPLPEMVDELLAILQKEDQTEFERLLIEPFSISDLLDMKAVNLMSRGQMEAALEIYKRIPATKWDDYGRYYPFKDNYQDTVSMSTEPDTSSVNTYLNRGELIQALLDLEFKAKGEVEMAARHYYQLGLAYYNISYFGYDWKAMDYFRSTATWQQLHQGKRGIYDYWKYPLGNRENTDVSRAFYFFEKARLLAKTKELKARAAFQAARCEQKMFFVSEQYKPEPCCNNIPRINEEYLTNFKKLKEEFSDTEFYEWIIDECKYFEVYATK